jgi:hypothetical protein
MNLKFFFLLLYVWILQHSYINGWQLPTMLVCVSSITILSLLIQKCWISLNIRKCFLSTIFYPYDIVVVLFLAHRQLSLWQMNPDICTTNIWVLRQLSISPALSPSYSIQSHPLPRPHPHPSLCILLSNYIR